MDSSADPNGRPDVAQKQDSMDYVFVLDASGSNGGQRKIVVVERRSGGISE